ncbi:MAG: hemerythrin domain-containing protein [Solirubrobacterales bacterium]|nr:hemerythrin domain-containing protein [Solirubrobacterales bacterium]
MKRHPALAPLSRDHQHTLAIAQRLRRATPATAEQAAAGFLAAWELEEKLHFRIEEEILLPAYAAHGDPGHPVVVRVLLDHLSIRCDAELLASEVSLQRLHALGERLALHVRLEEHELFPLIERSLTAAELSVLGDRLLAAAP